MPYESLRRGRVSLRNHYYVLTTITARREPIFGSIITARCAMRSLRQLDRETHTETLACVVMPDHVHWLMRLSGELSLAEIMRLFKGRCSRELSALASRPGPWWQHGFHDHAVRDERSLESIARYVIENPVRAGLADSIRAYPWWHAVWDFS